MIIQDMGLADENRKQGIVIPATLAAVDAAILAYLVDQFGDKARWWRKLPQVGGLRSRGVMEAVLAAGEADFIALCRPLINELELPNLLRAGVKDKSHCISSNNCWAEQNGVGIACKCPLEKIREG